MIKILTLNWNGADKLKKLYDSLLPNLTDIQYEWYIRDNASKDSSIADIESWNNSNIKLIKNTNNLSSFAAGMNFLFKESGAKDDDLILLLNNDVIFNGANSIKNMMKLFSDSDIGVVGSRLLFTGSDKIQHAGVVFQEQRLPMHFRANDLTDDKDKTNREFQAVTGAVWLTKAKYYNKICQTNKSGNNGLDESFIWAFEDIDACLAIKYNLGKKIVYCGETDIFHEESASLKKNPVHKMFMNQNIKHFKLKWFDKVKVDLSVYSKNNKHNLYKQG